MKKLLPLAVFILSSQAFALTSGIVSSETKVTPGHKGGVIHRSFETYPLTKEVKKKWLMSSGRTSTRVSNASGKVDENIRLTSDHSYEICNTDRSAAYFSISYELKDEHHNGTSQSDHVLILGNSCGRASSTLYFYNTYRDKGSYRLYAYSDIGGSNRSSDSATIYVSK